MQLLNALNLHIFTMTGGCERGSLAEGDIIIIIPLLSTALLVETV